MTGLKALPVLILALAAQPSGVAAAQVQPEPVSIVVDQNCVIQPDSAPAVLGDHTEAFRDSVVCHLESVLASHHLEERIIGGNDRDRSLVQIREREFILQNVTADPAVFVVRQDVPENWSVDSDPQPTAMDGSIAVFRVHAEPGQIVRLHVGLRNAVPLENAVAGGHCRIVPSLLLSSYHCMSESVPVPTLASTNRETPRDLPRVLGASQATAIVVGTIIGSGIFLVPREMMQDVGSSSLVYLAWIVGGILSLIGAMTYAELGAMMPYAGGEYVYLRGAYGDTTAFLYMWTWFAVAKPASIAAVTSGLARTLAVFPAFHWLGANIFGLPLLGSQPFAIVITWFMTGLNYLGIKKAGDFQLVFTILKGVLILIVAAFCFASSAGSWSNFGTSLPGATGGFNGFMAALIATLWAYDGWNDLTMVAGEVRNPGRSLPIALIGGLFVVGVLFMATNAAIQYILPAQQIAASQQPAVAALSVVAGPRGAGFVAAAMALSIFVTLNGTVMSGARIPFAAARDRLFFPQFAHINTRFQSPSTSLIVQGLLSTVLLVFLSQFQQHFELAVFSEWLFYMLTATSIFVYRRRQPDRLRPYRVWGYPVLPAIFVLCAAAVLAASYASNLKGSLIGTALILAGLPVLWIVRLKYGASIPIDESHAS